MEIKQYQKENLNFIHIKDDEFEVIFCDLGAAIYTIKYCDDYMIQTTISEKDFIFGKDYAGKTVGRVSNRIKGNEIVINNQKYILENNEGDNVLHGGKEGLSTKTFNATIKEKDDLVTVSYKYLSKDGESGFPGNLSIEIRYSILKGTNKLKIEFFASTDKDTPCSLTNHAYYSAGEPSLKNSKLWIDASNYLYCNPLDLTAIERRPVTDYLDFRKTKEIYKDIDNPIMVNSKAGGYDHNYYFDNNDDNKVKAKLIGTKYEMSIFTNFKCLQIYSNNVNNTVPHYGLTNGLHKSLAMEPQDSYDTLNILKPNEQYYRFITLIFQKI